ncbi:MAG TPA: hypothetical protein VIX59_21705 [Candidatus Binataceae bacterium]
MSGPANTNIMLVVALFVNPNCKDEFEQFESRAAEIMSRYGGRVELRIACSPGDDASRPDEVHIVVFPGTDSFDRYRQDPELQTLASLRVKAIRQTIVWPGTEFPPFGIAG